jgi:L-alanine-DL-glutamate epimerase-like enolase superfamily enzyme
VGGAIRIGPALEDFGFFWLEKPAHFDVRATGEVARALDSAVSGGEQTDARQGVADLIAAGVRMVQPDIVKMGASPALCRAPRSATPRR